MNSNRQYIVALAIVALILGSVLSSCSLIQGQGSEESLSDAWVLRYQRQGGIAGFCDEVTIYASGMATVTSCRSEPPTVVGEVSLAPEQQTALESWEETYSSWDYEETDPGVADAMSIHIEFIGRGDEALDEQAMRQMTDLVQEILRRAAQ